VNGPLRIALATIEYRPDPFSAGIGSYTKALADLLTARGHSVHVVARGLQRDERVVEDGVTVHRLTPGRPELPESLGPRQLAGLLARGLPQELAYRRKVAATLTRLASEEDLDLIEVADHLAEPLGYSPSRFPRVPFIVRLHTPLAVTEKAAPNIPEVARLGMRALERRLLLKATHLAAPSAVAGELILAEMGVTRPVEIYPNPPTLPSEEKAGRQQEERGLVLFIGRINLLKGPQLLLKAIPGILAAMPHTRFVFLGADNIPYGGHRTTGEYLLSLLPAHLRDRVELPGHVPHEQVESFYRRAAIVVLPSLFEAFGYTCLEAMSFGKAIVGSASGGMFELLDGGNAGLLFSPPKVEELQSHAIRLLADAELRRRLGETARRRALEVYGRDRVMDQVEEFYRRAIAERR
jgi:glycogen(starch) synthase